MNPTKGVVILTKAAILKLIAMISMQHEIDPAVVAAIVDVESSFNVNAKGGIGERGLMQLHPVFYKGNSFFRPQKNLEAGIAALASMSKRCPHSKGIAFVICHNRGVAGARRVKAPTKDTYYKKVSKAYRAYAKLFKEQKLKEMYAFRVSDGIVPPGMTQVLLRN